MAKLEILPKRLDILDINDSKCQFRINIDVLNEAFGVGRSMYAKGAYPDKQGDYISGDNEVDKYFIWMPKLYGNSSDWQNSISEDGTMIYESNINTDSDWIDRDKNDLKQLRIVFIKESAKSKYKFVGVYKVAEIKHCRHTYERIATRVRLVGNPVESVELLDDNRQNIFDINTPINHKGINVINGEEKVICGRCESIFIKASRCPICGQLIKY